MFWTISEANVTNLTRLFQTLFFYKIHNSYPNFLILYTKQSIMFSTRFVLFQSIACSRCPSPDLIVPVTMSQIGHVEAFFRQTSIIYTSNMTNT